MTHKLVLLVVICSLFSQINCDLKNKKSIRQNGLRFYQNEPLEWWKALVYSGNRNQQNLIGEKSSFDKLAKMKATADLARKLKLNDKSSDMLTSSDNLGVDQDEFEPVGQTDFELINFWPGLSKRDNDYGHLRFGRSADLRKPLDKKIESDYGHFRFGK